MQRSRAVRIDDFDVFGDQHSLHGRDHMTATHVQNARCVVHLRFASAILALPRYG
jgi:hypothetical protein